ncbi:MULTISPECIES: hypothetical protein [unclassified Rhizobium]|jgi:hypothetical protein|uniref:hypothetical protein n=1 Tax=unclassified Rhizobium TaxID=2613769 RepID=UPI000DD6EE8E|nr:MULTISPECIES: hypothetical protein [unclassified Rhizobium]MBB3441370.1 hypothetical protein [Rhizobium sp. BK379]MBB3558880.1 hypothetical protein [Rhizobium sp. BK512]
MTTHKRAAEHLFRPPQPDKASDAEKLQDVRRRLRLRQRETRQDERRQRQKTRAGLPAASS